MTAATTTTTSRYHQNRRQRGDKQRIQAKATTK